eukprot:29717-Chlamydomonas_euryale.AAC.12
MQKGGRAGKEGRVVVADAKNGADRGTPSSDARASSRGARLVVCLRVRAQRVQCTGKRGPQRSLCACQQGFELKVAGRGGLQEGD